MRKASTATGKKTRKNNNKLKFVIILVMLSYSSWVFVTQQIEIQSRKRALAQVEANVIQQIELQEKLAHRMELVNTPEYIERIAREQLGFARPDEIIFYDATLKK